MSDEPMNSRDALNASYRNFQDAEEAKTVAKAGGEESYANPYRDKRVRQCFQVYLMALSDEDSEVKTWEEARRLLQKVVDSQIDESLEHFRKPVFAYLDRVQDGAATAHPVYLKPPEFQ